jgi:hypothetical protein
MGKGGLQAEFLWGHHLENCHFEDQKGGGKI